MNSEIDVTMVTIPETDNMLMLDSSTLGSASKELVTWVLTIQT